MFNSGDAGGETKTGFTIISKKVRKTEVSKDTSNLQLKLQFPIKWTESQSHNNEKFREKVQLMNNCGRVVLSEPGEESEYNSTLQSNVNHNGPTWSTSQKHFIRATNLFGYTKILTSDLSRIVTPKWINAESNKVDCSALTPDNIACCKIIAIRRKTHPWEEVEYLGCENETSLNYVTLLKFSEKVVINQQIPPNALWYVHSCHQALTGAKKGAECVRLQNVMSGMFLCVDGNGEAEQSQDGQLIVCQNESMTPGTKFVIPPSSPSSSLPSSDDGEESKKEVKSEAITTFCGKQLWITPSSEEDQRSKIPKGKFMIQTHCSDGNLANFMAMFNPSRSAKIEMCHALPSSKQQFVWNLDGTITCCKNNNVLHVQNGNDNKDGTVIRLEKLRLQKDGLVVPNQIFDFDADGCIVHRQSGKVVDLAITANKLCLWKKHGKANQLWKLISVTKTEKGGKKEPEKRVYVFSREYNSIMLRIHPQEQKTGNEVKCLDSKNKVFLKIFETVTFAANPPLIRNGFCKIKTKEGILGWIREKYIRTENVETVSHFSGKSTLHWFVDEMDPLVCCGASFTNNTDTQHKCMNVSISRQPTKDLSALFCMTKFELLALKQKQDDLALKVQSYIERYSGLLSSSDFAKTVTMIDQGLFLNNDELEKHVIQLARSFRRKQRIEREKMIIAQRKEKIKNLLGSKEVQEISIKLDFNRTQREKYAALIADINDTEGLDSVKKFISTRFADAIGRRATDEDIDLRHLVLLGSLGTGKKTAAKLVARFGDVLEIFGNGEPIPDPDHLNPPRRAFINDPTDLRGLRTAVDLKSQKPSDDASGSGNNTKFKIGSLVRIRQESNSKTYLLYCDQYYNNGYGDGYGDGYGGHPFGHHPPIPPSTKRFKLFIDGKISSRTFSENELELFSSVSGASNSINQPLQAGDVVMIVNPDHPAVRSGYVQKNPLFQLLPAPLNKKCRESQNGRRCSKRNCRYQHISGKR
jgi:hypothetical protein